ncbi:MAG: ATP-binding cassette domain-containing protein, partial [Lachnospiraceae bacterium]|nr:ATP-binding cassette domain-containing protein [Lachnospiraceae bacterium]
MDNRKVILDIHNFSIAFEQYENGFKKTSLPTIRELDVTIHEGEMVAVVGSSGSGKSLLAHGILGIQPYNATLGGEIYYDGEILTEERKAALRGNEIVLVPQSVAFLDPLMKIG